MSAGKEPEARPRRGVINAEVFEATEEAKRISAEAQRRRQEILREAEARKEAIVAEGRELGREEGLAKVGSALAKAKMAAGSEVDASREAIAGLAGQIAEKIFGRPVPRDQAIIDHFIDSAIGELRRSRALTMRVNPTAILRLKEGQPRLMALVSRLPDLQIVEDPALELTRCELKSEFGTVTGTLSQQLKMLKEVLANAREPSEQS